MVVPPDWYVAPAYLLYLPLLRKLPGVTFFQTKIWTTGSVLRFLVTRLKFFCFTLLQTLLHFPETQPFCFQAIPNSFAKTPGGGVPPSAIIPPRIPGGG